MNHISCERFDHPDWFGFALKYDDPILCDIDIAEVRDWFNQNANGEHEIAFLFRSELTIYIKEERDATLFRLFFSILGEPQ